MTLSQSDVNDVESAINAVVAWANGGPSFVATMPNGLSVSSPSKVIADSLLFKDAIAWPPGGTVTDATQTYTDSGIVYAPQPSQLPFTGSGAFIASQFYVVQGILGAALADQSTTGSQFVGYRGETVEEFLDGVESIAAAFAMDLTGVDRIKTTSYLPGWAATVAGPKGGATYHRDGSTPGTPLTLFTNRDGFYDSNGVAYRLSGTTWNVFMFGALGNDSDDDSPAIQFAINAAQDITTGAVILEFLRGLYIIDNPLFVTTLGNTNITFKGFNKYNTRLKAGPNLEAATPPTMAGTYSPVLAFNPIMAWDVTTGCTIEDLGFDGDDRDVYGLYVNESFFCNFTRMRIRNCNQRPFTAIRMQDVTMIDYAAFNCGQGGGSADGSTLFYDTSAIVMTAPNFEAIGTDRYSLEIFQPNNKGSWTLINPWFETGPSAALPALGFLSAGGRQGRSIGGEWTYGSRGSGHNLVDYKSSSATITRDGIVMTTDAAQSWDVEVNDISVPTQNITCGSDVTNCRVHGLFDAANVVNNSPAANGNSFEPSTFSDGSGYQSVSGGFRVNKTATASGLPNGTNDYIALFEELSLKLFGNANNKLELNSGILEYHSNLSQRFIPGSGNNHTVQLSGSGNFQVTSLPTSDPGGSGNVWSDSGTLKIT